MPFRRAQFPFWLLALPCLVLYVMVVAADAFSGWADLGVLLVAEVASVYAMALWLAPKALANRRYGRWLLVLYILLQALAMLLLLIGLSFAVGGMRVDAIGSLWAILHADNLAEVSLLLVPGTAAGVALYLVRKVQLLQREREIARLEGAARRDVPHTQLNLTTGVRGVLRRSPELALQAMDLQIGILKFYVSNAGMPTIPLCDEVAMARRYVAINHLGLSGPPSITVTVSGPDDVPVLQLLVYTLVENAYHHRDRSAPAGIRVVVGERRLDIISINKLRTDGGQADTTGTGLTTLAHRLRLHYPGRHRFTHGPQDGSYVVQVTVWW